MEREPWADWWSRSYVHEMTVLTAHGLTPTTDRRLLKGREQGIRTVLKAHGSNRTLSITISHQSNETSKQQAAHDPQRPMQILAKKLEKIKSLHKRQELTSSNSSAERVAATVAVVATWGVV